MHEGYRAQSIKFLGRENLSPRESVEYTDILESEEVLCGACTDVRENRNSCDFVGKGAAGE